MIDATELSRLKWRSRRGMLENDLVMERFFEHHTADLVLGESAAKKCEQGDVILLRHALRIALPDPVDKRLQNGPTWHQLSSKIAMIISQLPLTMK